MRSASSALMPNARPLPEFTMPLPGLLAEGVAGFTDGFCGLEGMFCSICAEAQAPKAANAMPQIIVVVCRMTAPCLGGHHRSGRLHAKQAQARAPSGAFRRREFAKKFHPPATDYLTG